MAIIYSAAVKNARLQAVIDAIGSGGSIVIGTTGMGTVLATIPLDTPAFDAPASGAMSLAGVPRTDTAAAATGTAAAGQITASDGTVVVDGLTVATSGGNINLNSTALQVNQTVQITGGTITHG